MIISRATALSGAAAATVAVVALADAASEHDGVSRLDPHLAADVLQVRNGPLTVLAHVLTFAGSEVVIGAAAVVLMLVLFRRHWYAEAVTLAIGMVGSAAMIVGIKHLVMRARPPALDRLGPVDRSFAFPSGHTLNSAVFLGLAVLTIGWSLPRRARRRAVVSAIALAVGIGLSRLYLGYHWGTDVLASWLLAGAWLTVVAVALPMLRNVVGHVVRSQSGVVSDPALANDRSTYHLKNRRERP